MSIRRVAIASAAVISVGILAGCSQGPSAGSPASTGSADASGMRVIPVTMADLDCTLIGGRVFPMAVEIEPVLLAPSAVAEYTYCPNPPGGVTGSTNSSQMAGTTVIKVKPESPSGVALANALIVPNEPAPPTPVPCPMTAMAYTPVYATGVDGQVWEVLQPVTSCGFPQEVVKTALSSIYSDAAPSAKPAT
jgi:hypothetical protein